jgi:type I pantothenate kinase
LLSIYVDATHRLYQAQRQFLGIRDRKVPYIIGVAGSVAVGKSTTARVLQALLARWSPRPKVEMVTTDGFLFPNAVLERQGLMQKKGFPESYDLPTLLAFLSDIKAGRRPVRAPVYSHLTYDIVPNEWVEVDRPDILIVEGVNVLQTGRLPRDGKAVPVVSDFFDFSVYIDADEPVLREWYVRRFLALRDTAFTDPRSYFHRYAVLSDEEATATAIAIWERTNRANLEDNILPTRPRATLILKKGADHVVETVALRRL